MSTPRALSITRSIATKLIERLEIRSPQEIDVELIAADRNVYVEFRELAHEAGHLIRTDKAGIIVVRSSARDSHHWRWVVAHELGHFLRHAALDQFNLCTDANLRDWYSTGGHEIEANEFAAELLMPAHLFKKYCDRNKPSLTDVRQAAELFETSLTATAIRFVTFTDEPVAVVHSTNGVVDWAKKTQNFPFFIARGQQLNAMTYAYDLSVGKQVADRPQLIDGAGWATGARADEVELQEHSVMLGSYASVLTFLWHKWT